MRINKNSAKTLLFNAIVQGVNSHERAKARTQVKEILENANVPGLTPCDIRNITWRAQKAFKGLFF